MANANPKLAELQEAIFEEAWEWLNDNLPPMARSVKRVVERGASPDEIRRLIIEEGGESRIGLATRCENAAKYLIRLKTIAE